MSYNVIVFGEMLWDCLPSGPIPGGAPMNVSLNLHQLSLQTELISAVGNDPDGKKLLEFLHSFGLSTDLIQMNLEYDTSKVLVDDSDPENMKYDIVSPVAWDFINWNEQIDQAVKNSDAFVFGTLGVRNTNSLNTLMQLLHHDTLRVFDVNLRPPFYDFEVIESLLKFTDVLKLNEDELAVFALFYELENDIEVVCKYLQRHYAIDVICVTLGSKGAVLYQNGVLTEHAGYKAQVADTIGAGDAFLSGFIKGFLEQKEPLEILDFACKLGAFVASKKGGAVRYALSDI